MAIILLPWVLFHLCTLMKEYKVIFENNVPVFARLMNVVSDKELLKLTRDGDKKYINWLIVYGDNETDALEIAAKVIDTIWAQYLSS
jgi:hypothetical protein